MFRMTMEGCGPYQIACKLTEQKVLITDAHMAQFDEGVNKNKTFKDPYGWGSSTTATKDKAPNLVKRIGKTTYRVRVHFNTTSKETMNDEMKRMLRNEVTRNGL